ncbi:MAG: 50S ribosomal protein L1 [Candidatus Caenarcaniphilales bacterium]|nr:50S ribosomal protein L1 [Candidatus Caenarcaniphilales bacterium]
MSHKKNSKRQQKIKDILKEYKNKKVQADKAIELLKSFPATKFDQTVELAVKLGIDTKQADQQVRSSLNLPAGTGKKIKVAVVTQGDNAKAAEQAGADRVGAEDLIKDIEKGNIDFDKLLASPDMMREMGKLGRILGPKGLMPNPKDGTVTNDIGTAVQSIKLGQQVSFRAEKDGAIVQFPIGRVSFPEADLMKNLKASIDTLQKLKPSKSKGVYFLSAHITCTMGGSVEVDPNRVMALVA